MNVLSAVKDGETSSFFGGHTKCTLTLENCLAVSYKVKHALTCNPATSQLGMDPSEIKTCSLGNLHTVV